MPHNHDIATAPPWLTLSDVKFVVPRAEFDLNLSYDRISLKDNFTDNNLSLHSIIPVACEPYVFVSLILKEKFCYKSNEHSIIIARFHNTDRGICKTSMSNNALKLWGITREQLSDVKHKLFVKMFQDIGGWLSLGGPLKTYMPGEYTAKTCAKDGLIDGVTAQWFVSLKYIKETVNVNYVGKKPSPDEVMGQLVPLQDGILFLTSNCHTFYVPYEQMQGGTEVKRLPNNPWFVELTLFLTHNRSDRLCLRVNKLEAYSLNEFMAVKIASTFSAIQSIDLPVMASVGTDIALGSTAVLDLSATIDGGNNDGHLNVSNTVNTIESDKDGRGSLSVVEQQSKGKMASINKDAILNTTFLLRNVTFVVPPESFDIRLSQKSLKLTNKLDETIECPLIDVSAVITVPREQFYYTFFPIKHSIKHKGVVYNLLIARSQMCERGSWTTSLPKEILKYLAVSNDLMIGYKSDVLGRMLSHLSVGLIETHAPGAYCGTSCEDGIINGVTALASHSADTRKFEASEFQYFGSTPIDIVETGRLIPLHGGIVFCTDDMGFYIPYNQIKGGAHIGQVGAEHACDDLLVFLSRDGVDNISFRIPNAESKSLAAFLVTKGVRDPTLLANHKSLQSTSPSVLFSNEQRQMLKSAVNAAGSRKMTEHVQFDESLLTSDISRMTVDTTNETDGEFDETARSSDDMTNGADLEHNDEHVPHTDCQKSNDDVPYNPVESELLTPVLAAENTDMTQRLMAVAAAMKGNSMDDGVQYFQLDQEAFINEHRDHLPADRGDVTDQISLGLDGDHHHVDQGVRSSGDVTNSDNGEEITSERRSVDIQEVDRDNARESDGHRNDMDNTDEIGGGLDGNNQLDHSSVSKTNFGDKRVQASSPTPTTSSRRPPVGTQKRVKRTPAAKTTPARTSMSKRLPNQTKIKLKYGKQQRQTPTTTTVSRTTRSRQSTNHRHTSRTNSAAISHKARPGPTVDCQDGGDLDDPDKLAVQQPGGSKYVLVNPKLNVLRKICDGQFDSKAIPRTITKTVERNKSYQNLLSDIVHIWSTLHTPNLTNVNGAGEIRDDTALDVETEDRVDITQRHGNFATRVVNTRQSAKRAKLKDEPSSSGGAIPPKRARLSRKAQKSSANEVIGYEHGGGHNNANVRPQYDRRGTAIKNHVLRDQIEEWGLTGQLWKQFGKEKQAFLRQLSSERIHIGCSPNSYRVTNSVYQYVVNQADVNQTEDAKKKRSDCSSKSRIKRMAND